MLLEIISWQKKFKKIGAFIPDGNYNMDKFLNFNLCLQKILLLFLIIQF